MIVKNLFELISSANLFMTPIQFNLLKTLGQNGPLTRKDICEKLDAPWTTAFDNLLKLEKKEYVKRFSVETGRRGRPKVFWDIDKLDLEDNT